MRHLRRLTTALAGLLLLVPAPADAADDDDVGRTARVPSAFTLAVVPDTQEEVLRRGDHRFAQRMRWLARRQRALDLRYVVHTGDVVNWGWLDPRQYAVARRAFRVLERAAIPYSLAVGNHDTRVVGWDGTGGYGGDAYVNNPECRRRFAATECDSSVLLRRTEELNAAFSAERFGRRVRAFEPGKVDNAFTTFRAGGRRWLVLTLESWPRAQVVDWAARVTRSHPRHNVVIATHAYLAGDGSISQSAEYGDTSGQLLYDRVVHPSTNVVLVLSGHAGRSGHRVDTAADGHRVASFLGTYHSGSANPVRLLRIDPRAGTVSARVVAPNRAERYPADRVSVDGMRFVR